MIRSGVRGGHRLCGVAEKLGMLDTEVSYTLPRGIVFTVPFYREDNRLDARDLEDYDRLTILRICDVLRSMSAATVFDCGADIGIISAKLCAASPNIARIFAFEPNRDAFQVLARNIAALPVEGRAYPDAVGNVEAAGSLVSPGYDRSSHARYVSPGTGDIRIRTIDSLGCSGGDIVLKIDVEGSELEVMEGARRTIAEARSVAVLFETHPAVVERTGRDPLVCARFLLGIRPFAFVFAESGAPFSETSPVPPGGWTSAMNILGTTLS